MTTDRIYHGGVAGLAPGDQILPTPNGRHRDGCPFCEARSDGLTATVDSQAIDPPTGHGDRVYVTTDRLLAKHYASLAGGDLYEVSAVDLHPSDEDKVIPAWTAHAATIIRVTERDVRLSDGERRRLWRRMGGTTAEWHRLLRSLPGVLSEVRNAT